MWQNVTTLSLVDPSSFLFSVFLDLLNIVSVPWSVWVLNINALGLEVLQLLDLLGWRHGSLQLLVGLEFVRFEVVPHEEWRAVGDLHGATKVLDGIDSFTSGVCHLEGDWCLKVSEFLLAFVKDLNTVFDLGQNTSLKHVFHSDWLRSVNMSFLNVVGELAKIQWLKVFVVVESIGTESDLGEPEAHRRLTTLKSWSNGAA